MRRQIARSAKSFFCSRQECVLNCAVHQRLESAARMKKIELSCHVRSVQETSVAFPIGFVPLGGISMWSGGCAWSKSEASKRLQLTARRRLEITVEPPCARNVKEIRNVCKNVQVRSHSLARRRTMSPPISGSVAIFRQTHFLKGQVWGYSSLSYCFIPFRLCISFWEWINEEKISAHLMSSFLLQSGCTIGNRRQRVKRSSRDAEISWADLPRRFSSCSGCQLCGFPPAFWPPGASSC